MVSPSKYSPGKRITFPVSSGQPVLCGQVDMSAALADHELIYAAGIDVDSALATRLSGVIDVAVTARQGRFLDVFAGAIGAAALVGFYQVPVVLSVAYGTKRYEKSLTITLQLST